MNGSTRIGRTAPAVLNLTKDAVEALVLRRSFARSRAGNGAGPKCSSSPFRLVRLAHQLPLGRELAALVVERLRQHGVRPTSTTVALGPDLAASGVFEIPQLSPREVESVLSRKAAGLVGVDPDDVAFSAIVLDSEAAEQRRWLVHACERRPLASFQAELRRHNFTVREVVPARTAPFLSSRCLAVADAEGATLIALFDAHTCSIGLLSGEYLVQLSVLPGGADAHLTGENKIRSFVQELRGIDAFWRRASRGGSVTAVVLGGVEPFVVRGIEFPIKASLGDVAVRALDEEIQGTQSEAGLAAGSLEGLDAVAADGTDPLDDATELARIALLESFCSRYVRALDMSLDLRPRARTLAAVGGASLVLWGAMAATVRAELSTDAYIIATGTKVAEVAASDLQTLRDLDTRILASEERLFTTLAEIRSASHVGLRVDRLLVGIESVFERRAYLLSATAVAGTLGVGEAGIVRLQGIVLDVPGETESVLTALEQDLGGLEDVSGAVVDMPSLGNGDGNAAAATLGDERAALRFSATLTLKGVPPPTDASDARAMTPTDGEAIGAGGERG